MVRKGSPVRVRLRAFLAAFAKVLSNVNVRNAVSGRFGVDADHDQYKWWALSCTSLGMLLVAMN